MLTCTYTYKLKTVHPKYYVETFQHKMYRKKLKIISYTYICRSKTKFFIYDAKTYKLFVIYRLKRYSLHTTWSINHSADGENGLNVLPLLFFSNVYVLYGRIFGFLYHYILNLYSCFNFTLYILAQLGT